MSLYEPNNQLQAPTACPECGEETYVTWSLTHYWIRCSLCDWEDHV